MKETILILLTIFIFSCNKTQDRIQVVEDENLTQKQIDSVLDEYSFEYSRVVFIDSLEKVIFPISTQKARGKSRSSKDSYYADSYPQYWNLIFYDLESGKTKLLTEKKTRISDFRTNLNEVGPILKNSVLYEISDTDYDLDNKLTYLDPKQLYISDINGDNFKRISSKNEHLKEYQIVPNTDKIIFQTLRDTNGDKQFNKKDELIWYLIDLSSKENPLEILNKKERNDVENLYFKQWLVKNNKA
jgi:hypothetical protein